MKKFLRHLKNLTLMLLSAGILLFLVALISVQGFIVWLNTPPGGNWLSGKIQSTMKESPYQVQMQDFSLSGLRGVRTAYLTVADEEGDFVQAQNVRLQLNPFPLPFKKLSASLSADALELLRQPVTSQQEEKKEAERLGEILVPDIYINQVGIGVYIDRLILSDNIVKDGLTLGVELVENLKFTDTEINNRGRLQLTNLSDNNLPGLPLELNHSLTFEEETQTLILQKLLAENEDNILEANGTYSVGQNILDLSATGRWENVNVISKDLNDPITFETTLNGRINDFNGTFNLQTTYKTIPATISANINRQAESIALSNVTADASDINVTGDMTYNLQTRLAEGTLNGTLQSLDMIEIFTKQQLTGSGDFKISATPQQEKQSATLEANIANLQYQDYSVQNIKANAAVPNVKEWKKSTATINISNGKVRQTEIVNATINVTPQEQGLGIDVQAKARSSKAFSVNGNTVISNFKPLSLTVDNLTIHAGEGRAALSGSLQNNIPDFRLETNNLDLAALPYVDLSTLPLQLDKLDGNLTGTIEAPVLNLDYALTSALENTPSTTFRGQATYEQEKARTSFSGEGRGIRTLNGTVSVPLQLSLRPFAFNLADTATLDGNLNGDFDLTALTSLFLPETYSLSGDINLQTQIAGTPFQPDVNGNLRLKNAHFTDEINNFQLRDINAQAQFSGQELMLTSFSAQDASGNGSLNMMGSVDLSTLQDPDINADLTMSNMTLLQGDQYDVRLNADLALQSQNNGYLLSGEITPQEIQINLPERFGKSIPSLNIVERGAKREKGPSFFEKFMMDMNFRADNQIFVRGWGLDAELGGELDITGSLKEPLVKGQLQTIRGRYEELGHRFAIDHAILRFQGTIPPSPYLNVKTSSELEGDVIAHIVITGRAVEPELQFTSTPSLPEDEVLSRILFGQDTSNISPYQAYQLAQTLARFSGKGGGGPDIMGTLRDVTGLDDLRVEGVGTGNTTIGAGKYISDNVYLELEQGTGENAGAASVEIEVTPKVKVESTARENGESEVGVFWEWSY